MEHDIYGTAPAGSKVRAFLNDQEIGTVTATNGQFHLENIEFARGPNVIRAEVTTLAGDVLRTEAEVLVPDKITASHIATLAELTPDDRIDALAGMGDDEDRARALLVYVRMCEAFIAGVDVDDEEIYAMIEYAGRTVPQFCGDIDELMARKRRAFRGDE